MSLVIVIIVIVDNFLYDAYPLNKVKNSEIFIGRPAHFVSSTEFNQSFLMSLSIIFTLNWYSFNKAYQDVSLASAFIYI